MRRALILGSLVVAALATPAAMVVGCDGGGQPEIVTSPDDDAGHGGLADAPPPDAPDDDAADGADAPDAPLAPVRVGITANPLGSGAGEDKEAALVTFAAGVRVVVERRTLAELDDAGVAALADDAAFDAAHGQRVVLELDVVDRKQDGRPAELAALAWDDPALLAALDDRIDAALGAAGSAVDALVVGRDADAFLDEHPDDRAAFEAMATHAIAHAHASPGAPPTLRVGVGFSYVGATTPDPSFSPLRQAGDLVPLTYVPDAATPSAVAAAMDGMIAAAGGQPIALLAVGLPTGGQDGSLDKQAAFFSSFFGALSPRRAAFPYVNAFELHDLAPSACAALAAAQGEAPDGPFTASACSLGLFLGTDPKPAWIEVVKGAAAFASP